MDRMGRSQRSLTKSILAMPPFGNPDTIDPRMNVSSRLEEYLARALSGFRFLALFAVIGALLASVLLFLKGTLEIIHGTAAFLKTIAHLSPPGPEDKAVILTVIPAVDNYLFATALLIFGMGLYDLFISETDPGSKAPAWQPAWIKIESLDDLRKQISEVVIMILIINFFDVSFAITLERPVDLLMLGGGILLVACSLFITQETCDQGKATLPRQG
jgi:uncharacterized membrane protein YqhA